MDITSCLQHLSKLWNKHQQATTQALSEIETQTNLLLPSDFIAFMQWSNGGEAKLPRVYLSVWQAEKIIALNRDYQIQHYLGGKVLGIASDGGPICFLLDYRNGESPKFASVNFGDLDPNEIKNIAPSFTDALVMAINGSLVGDNL